MNQPTNLDPNHSAARDPGDLARHIRPCDPATRLRRAGSEDDDFARGLFKASRGPEFAAAGLSGSTLDMLLDQQYRAQAAGYAARFPAAMSIIILHREQLVGRLVLAAAAAEGGRDWHIVDIAIVPSARGLGIGGDVIAAVAQAARQQGAERLTLSVFSDNAPARRLYERLGFVGTESAVQVAMVKRLL
jgi:ribosomal protein S18 acetylase RimI-like enzyme